MNTLKGIISYHTEEYGQIIVKLSSVMGSRGITRNRLRTLIGSRYEVVDRYYQGQKIEMVDLDFLARVCYVLDCRVEDLLEYQGPEGPEKPEMPEESEKLE